MAMLEVKDLQVYYGVIQALKGISFHVNQGEVIALIGANGAGKTTTLQTLTGILSPKSGSITVENKGKGILYADLITRVQLSNDTLPAVNDNLLMEIRYAHPDGTPISVNNIRQGTDFTAVISLTNTSGVSDYTRRLGDLQ